MRSASIVLALAMVMAATLAFLPPSAQAVEPPKLSIVVEAGGVDQLVFIPATIVVPQVPIILNVTLLNNGTGSALNAGHTFSIRDNAGVIHIEIWSNASGQRAYVEFAVNSTNQVYYRGELFRAEALQGGIKFFCFPHEQTGMVGRIVVGGVSPPVSPEIGVFLRAYWIGIIGLVAMLVWTGITYFLIKGTSRHHQDHREHIRRGLT